METQLVAIASGVGAFVVWVLLLFLWNRRKAPAEMAKAKAEAELEILALIGEGDNLLTRIVGDGKLRGGGDPDSDRTIRSLRLWKEKALRIVQRHSAVLGFSEDDLLDGRADLHIPANDTEDGRFALWVWNVCHRGDYSASVGEAADTVLGHRILLRRLQALFAKNNPRNHEKRYMATSRPV